MSYHRPHHPRHSHCNVVPCFVAGSRVITREGSKFVEDIRSGDFVLTQDNGYKEVAWAGKAAGNKCVRYNGSNFSPQHRISVRIDDEDVFISAKKLIERGEATWRLGPITFVHFMFDSHEVVCADGIWSESFFPGEWIMQNLPQAAEIYNLFPDLRETTFGLARPEYKMKQ